MLDDDGAALVGGPQRDGTLRVAPLGDDKDEGEEAEG